MKQVVLIAILCALAGCGGGRRAANDVPVVRIASGPISKACLASDRKARAPALCGCIQGVADQRLDPGEQRRAASFYRDPQAAQVVRQSDRKADEVFWKRYVRYAETAKTLCAQVK